MLMETNVLTNVVIKLFISLLGQNDKQIKKSMQGEMVGCLLIQTMPYIYKNDEIPEMCNMCFIKCPQYV